jgi:hypothetical protein
MSMMKIEGSGSASGSETGSISQRHGSAVPDPDQHQNVMDPQHWFFVFFSTGRSVTELMYFFPNSQLHGEFTRGMAYL